MDPPGTGKTTVARLIGRIYKHLGYLEKGHLVETDRAGLVASYVGQTAAKTEEVIESALGGVLFIDEAYSLSSGKGDKKDFGDEAIEILLKRMEDHRENLLVIVAGYPVEMKKFILSNPGLQSRFNKYHEFDHYTPAEMLDIINSFADQADFEFNTEAKAELEDLFEELYEQRHDAFGNARVVRNIFEQITEAQANRIIKETHLTEELLIKILPEDISTSQDFIKKYVGFRKAETVT